MMASPIGLISPELPKRPHLLGVKQRSGIEFMGSELQWTKAGEYV